MSWVFGYGSLVWRPAFPSVERRPARLDGWTRRFWQGSYDHRGTPDRPGRVVTLVREARGWCDGVVYRLGDDAPQILDALDVREQGGYERHDLPVLLDDGRVVSALVYVAAAGNRNHLGPASLTAIAEQVRGATGPSGANVEYVLRLHAALAEMGAADPHVAALAGLLTPAVG